MALANDGRDMERSVAKIVAGRLVALDLLRDAIVPDVFTAAQRPWDDERVGRPRSIKMPINARTRKSNAADLLSDESLFVPLP